MTKDQIRTIFMQRGFTIKEGQGDLKEYVYEAANDLIRAVQQEIAASAPNPSAEPVAWYRQTDITELTDSEPETDGWTPLYAAPLANPSDKQEAVGYLSTEPRKWDQCRIKPQGSFTIPVFMHAERNEPLTDEEIEEISHQRETWSVIEFARAIIAAAPLAQSAEQEPKHVETQPGSPNFDGAEAYEAYLNAQSAEQDRIDAERYRHLCETGFIPRDFEKQIDAEIAKGASK